MKLCLGLSVLFVLIGINMALAIKEEQKSVEARNGDEMNQQVAPETNINPNKRKPTKGAKKSSSSGQKAQKSTADERNQDDVKEILIKKPAVAPPKPSVTPQRKIQGIPGVDQD